MQEITFIVHESEEGGYVASGLNESIFTDAQTIEKLKLNIKEAVQCHFEDNDKKLIRLQMIHEEVFAI